MTDTAPVQPAGKPTAARMVALGAAASRLVPDIRVLVIFGVFGLAYKLLLMIEATPALLANSAFMIIVGATIGGGGLGTVIAFLFGGTKTGSDVMKAQNEAVISSGPPPTKVDGL